MSLHENSLRLIIELKQPFIVSMERAHEVPGFKGLYYSFLYMANIEFDYSKILLLLKMQASHTLLTVNDFREAIELGEISLASDLSSCSGTLPPAKA